MKRTLLLLGLLAHPALGQDNVRGKRLFLQCQACHSLAKGAPHKVGPNLHGTIGARAGSGVGYMYSPALSKSGLIWTPTTLDRWLAKPSAIVPGNKMIFAGVPRADDRAALIAYLTRAAR